MIRYIDADDVIKAVDKHTNNDGVLDDDITCILEEIQTADVKPIVYGEWIPNFQEVEDVKTGETWLETTSYHCSVCNDGYVEEKRNFCPCCGASMGKESEEEE